MPKLIKLKDGIFFTSIENKTYKTELLTVNFIFPLSEESYTSAALIAKILPRGSKKFPTLADFNKAMDLAYDVTTSVKIQKLGENCVLSFSCDFLRNRFAYDDFCISEKATDIFFDMIFNPLGNEKKEFSADYFESEKQKMILENRAKINHKASYARRKLFSVMFEGESFSAGEFLNEELLDSFTPKSLFSAYESIINEARIEAFYVGDAPQAIEMRLREIPENCRLIPRESKGSPISKPQRRVFEKMDVSQAQLAIGYRSALCFEDRRPAVTLFLTMFGASPSSRLFRILREKHSLCYDVSARSVTLQNIMYVQSGLTGENINKAEEIIAGELKSIAMGDFSDKELNEAKIYSAAFLKTVSERPESAVAYYFPMTVGSFNMTPEEFSEKIMNTGRDEIMEIARSMIPDTVFAIVEK